jgi:three-Cys-motif partner protein
VVKKFFDESREQSQIKAEIVEHYFDAWAQIIISTQKRFPHHSQRIGYIDLFAGPGRYKDGATSTPIRVLEKAISNPEIAERLVTIFNDKEPENISSLKDEIANVAGIQQLKTPPDVWNKEIGDEIAKQFGEMNKIPILAFIDPWGYKGLSLKLVNAFLKDWGCDCIFFFNYSRINAGLSNPMVREHMEALFGTDTAAELKEILKDKTPDVREAIIVEKLSQSLRGMGAANFVLPFCFKSETGKRTKHHLVFVTKHFKGYEVMKEIMATASSSEEQGVASFQYSPAAGNETQLLFSLNRPLDDLKGILLEEFSGRRVAMLDIYKQHSVDTPYTKKNYKVVLRQLEDENLISTENRKSKSGFADSLIAVFP